MDLTKSLVKYMAKTINKKGRECKETPEDIFDNIDVLAKDIDNFGEKSFYLPLQVKKILALIAFPKNRIEYQVEEGVINQGTVSEEPWVKCVARFYEDRESVIPSGEGMVKVFLSSIDDGSFLSNIGRMSNLEALARGKAATRAITDAGIGIQFYGDLFEPETIKEKSEIPIPPTTEEVINKKKGRKKKNEESDPVVVSTEKEEKVNNISVTKESSILVDNLIDDDDEYPEEEPVETLASSTISTTPTILSSSISFEEARERIADIGQFTGCKLGDIYDKQPRGIIWLKNQNSKEQEALTILINSDPELAGLMK